MNARNDDTPTRDPPTCYAIARWAELFENNESRKLDNLRWFPMRVLLADESFAELLDDEQGPADFGVFVAMLMVAATARPRGHLLKTNGTPQDARSIARQIRVPLASVEHAIGRLVEIGLVLNVPVPPPATDSRSSGSESRSVGNGSRSSGPYIGEDRIGHTGEEKEERRAPTSEAAGEAAADDDAPSLLLIGELGIGYKIDDLKPLTAAIRTHGLEQVRVVLQDSKTRAKEPTSVVPYALRTLENRVASATASDPVSVMLRELGIIGCNGESKAVLGDLLGHFQPFEVKSQLINAVSVCGANQAAVSYAAKALGDMKARSTPPWMVKTNRYESAVAVREDR